MIRIICTPDGTVTPLMWLATAIVVAREVFGGTVTDRQFTQTSLTVSMSLQANARGVFMSTFRHMVDMPLDGNVLRVELL